MSPLRSWILTAAFASAACSGNSTNPAPLPDVGLTADVRGPNEVFLAWQPPPGTSSILLRDGTPITPPLSGSSWLDLDVMTDRSYAYAVEVRDAGSRVVAGGMLTVRTAGLAGWTTRDLATAGGVGRTASAISADGTLVFTFHDANAGALVFGTDDGSAAAFEEVARGETTGRLADLAIDSTGVVRIAFEWFDDLHYATPAAGGGFDVVEIARLAEPQSIAIAVDDADRAHVVYRALIDQTGLRYREQSANGWIHAAIPALGPTIGDVDVVSLGGGDLAVLYFAGMPGRYIAHVASRRAGSWSTEPIVEVDRPTGSLAVDVAGVLHVALLDVEDLLHAEGAPGSWLIENLGGAARGARQATIAVSVFRDVHVALHGRAQDLIHLVRVDGDWTEEFVDADGNVGEGASIALDRTAPARIVYHDVSTGTLRLADER